MIFGSIRTIGIFTLEQVTTSEKNSAKSRLHTKDVLSPVTSSYSDSASVLLIVPFWLLVRYSFMLTSEPPMWKPVS